MKNISFKKKLIASTIGSYALVGLSGMAVAQDNPQMVAEEVIVTGIRGSLMRAMDIKRDSAGVVDAISAEDIGKFPDTNLAESLQRITGVSIDRANGEGSKVTVRGFGPDYNLTLLNGRQMPASSLEGTSASSSRSFDFANLASEGVAGVEVYKTGRANVATGGIGATINILTSRPLDNPGLNASFGVKGVMDTSTEEGQSVTPEVSALFSQTFADDTIGISLSGSYQERESGNQQAVVGGWFTNPGDDGNLDPSWQQNGPGPDDLYSRPQSLGYMFSEVQRTRTNGQLVLQWAPTDSITGTLDYTYSLNEVANQFNDMSAWFNGGVNAVSALWSDEAVKTPLLWTETPQFSENYDYENNNDRPADIAMAAGSYATANENKSAGFNLEWHATDRLSFELDAHSSEAESRPDSIYGSNNTLASSIFTRASATADFRNDFPVLSITPPEGEALLTPGKMRVTGSSFRNSMMRSEVDQIQLSGTLEFDEGDSIDFGVASTDVSNRSVYSFVQRDTWGGVSAAGDFDDSFWPVETIADKFDVPGSDSSHLVNEFYAWDFDAVRARTAELYPGTGGDCGNVLCASSDYGTDRRTEEESTAAYVQVNIESELGEMPVHMSAGIRYEKTDVTSSALVPTYSGIGWVGNNEFNLVATGEQDFTELTGGYDHLLPNVDFDIEVLDDVVLRASFSETLARPSYQDIQGGLTVASLLRIDGGDGARGNPNLLPFQSKNLDLSAEWYYADASYVSAGYFRKNVTNFIGNSIVQEEVFSMPHPGTGPRYDEANAATGGNDNLGAIRQYIIDNTPAGDPSVSGQTIYGIAGEDDVAVFDITIPVNEKDAQLEGWELAVQHVFGDTGFGAIANFTLVNGDVSYDDTSLEEQFALLGLSDSANFIAFYDKHGLQARVAYNWRDDFLASTGQATGGHPTYVEAYGQWDLNVSYDLLDNLTVFVEGLNITDEYTRAYGRAESQTLNVTQTGPRYNIGARYTF